MDVKIGKGVLRYVGFDVQGNQEACADINYNRNLRGSWQVYVLLSSKNFRTVRLNSKEAAYVVPIDELAKEMVIALNEAEEKARGVTKK